MNLDAFIEEIEHLKEAKEILKRIYSELGPYNLDIFPKDLAQKIRNYFRFDDSE